MLEIKLCFQLDWDGASLCLKCAWGDSKPQDGELSNSWQLVLLPPSAILSRSTICSEYVQKSDQHRKIAQKCIFLLDLISLLPGSWEHDIHSVDCRWQGKWHGPLPSPHGVFAHVCSFAHSLSPPDKGFSHSISCFDSVTFCNLHSLLSFFFFFFK